MDIGRPRERRQSRTRAGRAKSYHETERRRTSRRARCHCSGRIASALPEMHLLWELCISCLALLQPLMVILLHVLTEPQVDIELRPLQLLYGCIEGSCLFFQHLL